jgi:hypothetical protein
MDLGGDRFVCRSALVMWSLLWLAAGGCGQRGPEHAPVFPARGELFVNGKPAVGAVVRLHADQPAAEVPLLPRGVVKADGSFVVTTYKTGDGAPAGRYRVSVIWQRRGPEDADEGKTLLPERYSRPESSGLQIEIMPRTENKIPPFHLQK